MRNTIHTSPAVLEIGTLTVGYLVYANPGDSHHNIFSFFILTILLMVYLLIKIQREKKLNGDRWLLNPAVLCSILSFFVPFGIGNLLYLLSDEKSSLFGLDSFVSESMVKMEFLALLSAVSMWLGYWVPFAVKIGIMMGRTTVIRALNSTQHIPKLPVIIFCYLLSLSAKLILIKLGIFGYNADAASLSSSASIRQYLTIFEMLGELTLIVISIHYFTLQSPGKFLRNLLVGIVLFETLFGFLSGFKSAVVIPSLTVGVCYYYCKNRINIKIMFTATLLLFIAYAVVEPYRLARNENKDFLNTSLQSIAKTFYNTASVGLSSQEPSVSEVPVLVQIITRSSLTYIGSLGIEYIDKNELPEGSPNFLQDIFLSPLYSFVPRFLWESKETRRHGQWYLKEVMGVQSSDTSVGMGPITYLYLAGSWFAVILGFLFVGIMQRLFTSVLLEHGGVIYLALLSNFVIIDTVYYTFIQDTLRSALIITIYFLFTYRIISADNSNNLL